MPDDIQKMEETTIPKSEHLHLRPFQREDLEFFLRAKRAGVWWEPRLGKTVLALHVALLDPKVKRVVVDCPKNALNVWEDHIIEWSKKILPDTMVTIIKVSGKNTTKAKRMAAWSQRGKDNGKTFYLVVHQALFFDVPDLMVKTFGFKFDMFIWDEYHKSMKRRTKTFKLLGTDTPKDKRVGFLKNVYRVLFLSGTPIDRNIQEFWPALHIFDRTYFSSYWKYIGDWCIQEETFFGRIIVGPNWARKEAFSGMMRNYGRVRLRKNVAPQMPTIQREIIHIDLNEEQRRIYETLDLDNVVFSGNQMILAQTSMEKVLRFRQLCCCPKILVEDLGVGAAIEDLGDRLEEAVHEQERHVVIFVPFIKAIPYLVEYLHGRGIADIETLQGGTDPDDMRLKLTRFCQAHGVMVCSTHFAQAFSLDSAFQCYHVGFDWQPNINKQAEDRLIPQQAEGHITSSYYVCRNTIDEAVANTVIRKNLIITAVLNHADRTHKDVRCTL